MPIVQPAGFDAMGLLLFEINPHYVDADASWRHMGETREEGPGAGLSDLARSVIA